MLLSWRQKRNRIVYLIKFLSDYYGGDDIEWLRDYAREVLETNKDDLDGALSCFNSLTDGMDVDPHGGLVKPVTMGACRTCGYLPPFCRWDLGQGCSFDKPMEKENVSELANG